MKPPGNPKGKVWAVVFCLTAAAALAARPAPERTRFKDLPANDPVREVIQTVLRSKFYSLRSLFPREEWSGAGYGAAWERAKGYFPSQIYLVRPGTYFMTHGFDADGRLFMEVHESAYLALCAENRGTFEPDSVVAEYGRMRAAANGQEAASFGEKLGRLEAAFRDDAAHRDLRKRLGAAIYDRLLDGLREENYHMLAAGLMHEGMHAALDDAQAARLQAEFRAGDRPVQWDELRAFMAETGYHARFSGWAVAEVLSGWGEIDSLLKRLEVFRKTSKPPAGAARVRFEQTISQAWAQADISRLRAREIWQSARRILELIAGFRKDYVRDGAPPDLETALAGLEKEGAAFAAAAGEAIRANELALRSLEDVLDIWGAWADGQRPYPPPMTDSQSVLKEARSVRWPDAEAAASSAAALMRRAGQELAKD